MFDDNPAPSNACIFNERNEHVTLADTNASDKNKFRITGYSGGIIKAHWYWGNLAIDLSGTKFRKKRLAVLESHFTDKRIGFTTKQTIENDITVEGDFLSNENAKAMKADIDQGFPMEASLFCMPSVIERVSEGASVQVNGVTLKGPGAVFRKSEIKEVSMCVFGYDRKTKSAAAFADNDKIKFSLITENEIMNDKKEITSLVKLEEIYPDLYKQLFEKGKTEGIAEGEQKSKTSFEALQEVCGDDNELLVTCFKEQKTTIETSQLLIAKLKEKNKTLSETPGTETTKKVDPANAEFTDNAENSQNVKFDEKTATDEQVKVKFSETQELQDEFGDYESYLSYIKREVRDK